MVVDVDRLDALARWVADAVPGLARAVPGEPGARLGRVGIPEGLQPARSTVSGPPLRPAHGWNGPRGTGVADVLADLDPLLAERLLGALELAVPRLDVAAAPDLTDLVPLPPTTRAVGVAVWLGGGTPGVSTALSFLEALHPGRATALLDLAVRLAARPVLVPLLASPSVAALGIEGACQERAAVRLALGVATAAAGTAGLTWPGPASDAAAVIGVGLAAAVRLLEEAPPPVGYAEAVLDRMRAEYRLPARFWASVDVVDHRFGLVEGDVLPDGGDADVAGNGLAAAVPGGLVVRTGRSAGPVRVSVQVLDGPPGEPERPWDEVVDLPVEFRRGLASLRPVSAQGFDAALDRIGPPDAGSWRARVQATGRDEGGEAENYEVVLWAAPPSPEVVYRRTDRIGHVLRGQTPPPRQDPGDAPFRWVESGPLQVAATVTLVVGRTAADVLRSLGADPGRPEPAEHLSVIDPVTYHTDPWAWVLEDDGLVVVVEENGWCCSMGDQLAAVTAGAPGARAASYYWNVNAVTRLTFAVDGRCLDSFEAGFESAEDPAVAALLGDVDFEDYRHKTAKGLSVVSRFVGRQVEPRHLEAMISGGTGYRLRAPA